MRKNSFDDMEDAAVSQSGEVVDVGVVTTHVSEIQQAKNNDTEEKMTAANEPEVSPASEVRDWSGNSL